MEDHIEIEIAIEEPKHAEGLHALGVNRIELCANLNEGGLTPTFGQARETAAVTPIPVYAMLRPRAGDFHYTKSEQHQMLLDLDMLAKAGVQGIVVGALTAERALDQRFIHLIADRAKQYNLGMTFHRAFDACADPQKMLLQLIDLGVERVLSSGFESKVDSSQLAKIMAWSQNRIQIQAGSGVHADVVTELKNAGIRAFHCTARKWSAPEQDGLGFSGQWNRDDNKIRALVKAARTNYFGVG
jgi:copper homeostasis protein